MKKMEIEMMLMKQKLTKSELDTVRDFLEECSKAYYNTDKVIITDTDYDYFYNRYIELGGEEIMGAEVDDEKGTVNSDHKYKRLVGSLEKAQNIDDFIEWLERVYPNPKDIIRLIVTLKFDGNSIAIEYDKDGNVLKALTRGRDGKGKDLTKVFKKRKINNPFGCPMGIKYEAIIKYSLLDEMNEKFGTNYKNPRSAISGKLNSDDSYLFEEYYNLEPLWVQPMNFDLTREEELNYIEQEFPESFNSQYVYELSGDRAEIIQDIKDIYEEIINTRQSLDFMIDGLVIDIVDKKKREELGFIEGGKTLKPKWATALKFPYMQSESRVVGFNFTLGDSGKISPNVIFEPVMFNGATYTKQYLQGYKRFKKLGLAIGSRILVQLSNDTLTYIERFEETDKENETPYPFTKECPVCGGEVVINDNETFAYCANPFCQGKTVGRINNYVTKMDIKGIKTNTIQKIYEAGIWNKIEDLYLFDPEEVAKVEGLGDSSATKILKSIEKKKYYDYEIIGSLGISGFSLATAKDVVQAISLDDLITLLDDPNNFYNRIIGVEGVADILAKNIYEGLNQNRELIKFLMARGYKKLSDENAFDDVRYTFVVTGDLYKISSRDELKRILERRGHKMVGSVSGKTDFLVTNEPNSGTVKNKKAQALGKPIITEDELIEMLKLEY
jgi:DNA ligase (NAD+)